MNLTQTENQCQLIDLGLISYDLAYALFDHYIEMAINNHQQSLLLCEHPPVITKGRMTKKEHILVKEDQLKGLGFDIKSVDRGGDVTLHAPGQLVVYPILDLKQYGRDLHSYLRKLEDVIISTLDKFNLKGKRSPDQTGVWVQDKKIASIGIGVKKWVSFHGIAINVNTDLDLFSVIKPCGLDVTMTSMKEQCQNEISLSKVKEVVVENIFKIFDLRA